MSGGRESARRGDDLVVSAIADDGFVGIAAFRRSSCLCARSPRKEADLTNRRAVR
jgi:hypothetical protein